MNDTEQRLQTLKPSSSFIVRAPAGSGKTSLLIQRYLSLLSVVENPEEIVAITFTRKAAAEMCHRILLALRQASDTDYSPTQTYQKQLLDLAKKALERDAQQSWSLLENPNRLRIQTIDSLCYTLATSTPLRSQFATQTNVVDDAHLLYEQAVDDALYTLADDRYWSEEIKQLFAYLSNDLTKIKKILIDMLAKRGKWLLSSGSLFEYSQQNHQDSLKCLINLQIDILEQYFPKAEHAEIQNLLRHAASNLPENHQFSNYLNSASTDLFRSLDYWQCVQTLFLTKTGAWRARVNKNTGFIAKSNEKKAWESLSDRLKNNEDEETLRQNLSLVHHLKTFSERDLSLMNGVNAILKLVVAQLKLVSAKNHNIDFFGVFESAMRALGSDEQPSDLLMRLDYKIRHILVDEFQDVSIGQYQLIKKLSQEWPATQTHSLFLVGDPMQSIYRFRQADVSIFIETFSKKRLGSVALTPLELNLNFRSQSGLIDWFNQSFQRIMSTKSDSYTGRISFSPATSVIPKLTEPSVQYHPFYDKDFEQQAKRLRDVVTQLQQAHPEDTIAILLRNRSRANPIINVLRDQNIKCSAVEIMSLRQKPIILDLLSLTYAFLCPADRLAWLSCLRAPWCGLSLNGLYQIALRYKDRTILQCLFENSCLEVLSQNERRRAIFLRDQFTHALSQRQRYSIRFAIESLWYCLGGPATVCQQELTDCNTYFSLLEKSTEHILKGDLKIFEERLSRSYASTEEGDNRLQIMTIHKAKGLEFDHVLLPALGYRSFTTSQRKSLLKELLFEYGDNTELIFSLVPEESGEQQNLYEYITGIEKQRQYYEEQRLVYVATTRAKKSLHLFGHIKTTGENAEPDKNTLLEHLWPVMRQYYEKHDPTSQQETYQSQLPPNKQRHRRLAPDWKLPNLKTKRDVTTSEKWHIMDKDNIVEYNWAGITALKIGSVVHHFLQSIAEDSLAKWPIERLQDEKKNIAWHLRQHTITGEEQETALDSILLALKNVLSDRQGRWILSDTHTEAYNEHPISGYINGIIKHAVIDRTFLDQQNRRWIIDYKTGTHQGADTNKFLDEEKTRYREQLEEYALLWHHLHGLDQIHLGLYFPMLCGWRTWVFHALEP